MTSCVPVTCAHLSNIRLAIAISGQFITYELEILFAQKKCQLVLKAEFVASAPFIFSMILVPLGIEKLTLRR